MAIVFVITLSLLSVTTRVVPQAPLPDILPRNYKISGDAPPFTNVLSSFQSYFEPKVKISPDGKYVVFWADFSTDDAHDLYSVPLDGSAPPTRLSYLHTTDTVGDFKILPDSRRVIYWIDNQQDGTAEINSVPIAGGTIIELSDSFLSPNYNGGRIFELTADSAHVIFVSNSGPGNVLALYSVPSAGGPEVRLSPLSNSVDLLSFRISTDGSRVVFSMDTEKGSIYSVPSGGGDIETLAGNFLLGESLYQNYFKLSPDGSLVYYIVHRTLLFPPRDALYSVPIGGGERTLLHNDLAQFEKNQVTISASPDNQHVVVGVNYFDKDEAEIFSLPASGGDKTPLHNSPLKNLYDARFDGEGDRVVYTARLTGEIATDLFSVPVTGGTAVKLDQEGGRIDQYGITPNGARVIYAANPENGIYPLRLYSVPIMGGQVTELSAPMPQNSLGVYNFMIAPDGHHVLYLAQQQSADVWELYLVPTAGGELAKLNGPLPVGANIGADSWTIGPNGRTVVYVADQDVVGKHELYATFLGATTYLPHIGR